MQLLTAKEVAKRLKVTVQTVYKMGRLGKLKTKRFGRTVRFIMKWSPIHD